MKKIFNFALYDFANSAFTTIIITFIFSTYFAKQIAPTPILGQSYWGWTIGITGLLIALIGPFIGSFADKKNCIVLFIRLFTICCIFFTFCSSSTLLFLATDPCHIFVLLKNRLN